LVDRLFRSPQKRGKLARQEIPVTFYTFEVLVEKEPEDEGYLAYSPTLPGCFSNGKTIEEAKRNFREALQQHLASLLAHGEPIPQKENLVHVEELTVGIP
jgi:antitoxin HicB